MTDQINLAHAQHELLTAPWFNRDAQNAHRQSRILCVNGYKVRLRCLRLARSKAKLASPSGSAWGLAPESLSASGPRSSLSPAPAFTVWGISADRRTAGRAVAFSPPPPPRAPEKFQRSQPSRASVRHRRQALARGRHGLHDSPDRSPQGQLGPMTGRGSSWPTRNARAGPHLVRERNSPR